ncbi:MAG: dipeptide ABC transporter ATP-binding protein [Clostridia bacterium]|nr:dipeptide ABC transporter ATP-binding protein [Clostridia bacterium]
MDTAVETPVYDDEALTAAYREKRQQQIEEDLGQPFDPDCLLEVRHLRKCFPLKKTMFGKVTRELVAVDDISFKLKAGETLGIVGESGCGKTTAGRAILKLHEPTAGQIIFDGQDITHYKSKQMREIRKQMQIIFQDPYSSLPPRDTVGGLLSEPVQVHKIVPKDQVKDYVLRLMEKCGLRDYYFERYPHEFSGGQRQRICIARALAVNPKLVICDEPVSALDVSIQAQIINLLKKLQREMNLAYVFISHDLSVVKFISDKIGVMYLGGMMEFGTKEDIFRNPLHPYTKALFSAVPNPDPTQKMQRIALGGDIPSPANPPKGCRFHTRCPYAKEICKHVVPEYKEHEPGHFAACHLLEEA